MSDMKNMMTVHESLDYIHMRQKTVSYDMFLRHIQTLEIGKKINGGYFVSKDDLDKLIAGELYIKKYIELKDIG